MEEIYIPASEYRDMFRADYLPCKWQLIQTNVELRALAFSQKPLNPYIHIMDDRLRSSYQRNLEVSPGTLVIEEEVLTLEREELLRQYTLFGHLDEEVESLAAGTPVMVILADGVFSMFAQVGGPHKF